jgi:hypothetical protein
MPLRWVRASPGLWHLWPPRQFETSEPDGPNIWCHLSRGSYAPVRPCRIVPPHAPAADCGGSETIQTGWGGPVPAQWSHYEDGRTLVSLGRLEVNLPPSRVSFNWVSSFPGHELDFFEPSFIWNPPISPPSQWASCRRASIAEADVLARSWFYPTPDGRRWVAHAWTNPRV